MSLLAGAIKQKQWRVAAFCLLCGFLEALDRYPDLFWDKGGNDGETEG